MSTLYHRTVFRSIATAAAECSTLAGPGTTGSRISGARRFVPGLERCFLSPMLAWQRRWVMHIDDLAARDLRQLRSLKFVQSDPAQFPRWDQVRYFDFANAFPLHIDSARRRDHWRAPHRDGAIYDRSRFVGLGVPRALYRAMMQGTIPPSPQSGVPSARVAPSR
jgi:hypothetical protein